MAPNIRTLVTTVLLAAAPLAGAQQKGMLELDVIGGRAAALPIAATALLTAVGSSRKRSW